MLSLTCAISEYDHVRDLASGQVRADGIALSCLSMPVEEIFFRMLRNREFDVARQDRQPRRCRLSTSSSSASASPSAAAEISGASRSHSAPDSMPATRRVKLCRPSEAVLDILPRPQRGPFTKEDGERVIDGQGRRIDAS